MNKLLLVALSMAVFVPECISRKIECYECGYLDTTTVMPCTNFERDRKRVPCESCATLTEDGTGKEVYGCYDSLESIMDVASGKCESGSITISEYRYTGTACRCSKSLCNSAAVERVNWLTCTMFCIATVLYVLA